MKLLLILTQKNKNKNKNTAYSSCSKIEDDPAP